MMVDIECILSVYLWIDLKCRIIKYIESGNKEDECFFWIENICYFRS